MERKEENGMRLTLRMLKEQFSDNVRPNINIRLYSEFSLEEARLYTAREENEVGTCGRTGPGARTKRIVWRRQDRPSS
jgi:hypothetical protein